MELHSGRQCRIMEIVCVSVCLSVCSYGYLAMATMPSSSSSSASSSSLSLSRSCARNGYILAGKNSLCVCVCVLQIFSFSFFVVIFLHVPCFLFFVWAGRFHTQNQFKGRGETETQRHRETETERVHTRSAIRTRSHQKQQYVHFSSAHLIGHHSHIPLVFFFSKKSKPCFAFRWIHSLVYNRVRANCTEEEEDDQLVFCRVLDSCYGTMFYHHFRSSPNHRFSIEVEDQSCFENINPSHCDLNPQYGLLANC